MWGFAEDRLYLQKAEEQGKQPPDQVCLSANSSPESKSRAEFLSWASLMIQLVGSRNLIIVTHVHRHLTCFEGHLRAACRVSDGILAP